MKQLTSVQELQSLREQTQKQAAERGKKIQVKVHLGTCGIASGADKILEAFTHEVETRKLFDVLVLKAACIGLCSREPIVSVIWPGQQRVIYGDVTVDKIPRIIDEHLMREEVIEEWAISEDTPWFKLQEIRVMHNQDLNPMNIEEYISRDGYQALAKVLTEMSPDEVIEEVRKSGLRGRGEQDSLQLLSGVLSAALLVMRNT